MQKRMVWPMVPSHGNVAVSFAALSRIAPEGSHPRVSSY